MKQIVFFTTLFLIFFSDMEIIGQNEAIRQFANIRGIVFDICFSKDSTKLAIAQGNTINFYDFKTEKYLFSLKNGHTKSILSFDISPDDAYLVSGGQDDKVILWDVKTQSILKKLDYHQGVVTSVKFSPDQSKIASGSADNMVILYDIQSDKILFKFDTHKKDVGALAFSPSGEILASAGEDRVINIFNVRSGELISQLNEHKNFIRSIKFSPDGTRLVSGDDNSRLIIWKIDFEGKAKIIDDNNLFLGWISSVDIGDDSRSFLAGGLNGKYQLISFFSKTEYNIKSPVHKAIFIPDPSQIIKLAIATRGNGVLIIDMSK
jgi:WD40 repeat protein